MKIKPNHLLLALLASATASAQEPAPRAPQGQPGVPVHPLLVLLDKDRDGEISARELRGAEKTIAALDGNGDGKLTREEIFQPNQNPKSGPTPYKPQNGPQDGPQNRIQPKPPGPPGPPMLPPVFVALDADHNGKITEDELANAEKALRSLDKDGDGVLTPPELLHIGPMPRDKPPGEPRPPQGPPPNQPQDPPQDPQPQDGQTATPPADPDVR